MKAYILIFLILFVSSCTIIKFSQSGILKSALDGDNTTIKKCVNVGSVKIAESYNDFRSNSQNVNKLYTFKEGCYMIKIIETIDTVNVGRANKTRKNIEILTYKTQNSTDPSYSDKVIYLVFLDNERVLYHSPYRKNYIKNGEFGRLKFDSCAVNEKHRARKRYARKTENYFKLDSEYEYNSFKRGYYKITNDFLYVWLEKGDSKENLDLIRMGFKFFPDIDSTNRIGSLSFEKVNFKDKNYDVDDFYNFKGDKTKQSKGNTSKSGITFEYFPMKFRPMLVKQNFGLISSISDTLINGNPHRKYKIKCNLNGCETEHIYNEPKDDLTTF